MAEGEGQGKVRLRTYNQYMTGEVPRKGGDKPDVAKMFWSKSLMFLVFGLVFLCLILFLPQETLMNLVMLVIIDGILFVAFAANLYVFWKSGSQEGSNSGTVSFNCRHCGKGFSDERLGRKHESTCVEMKL